MAEIGRWKKKVHEKTLNVYGIYQNLAGYYHLYNLVSYCLIIMYKSCGERGGNKKSKILLGDGRIEDHWFNMNRLTNRRSLTFNDLDLGLEMKMGDEGKQDLDTSQWRHKWRHYTLHYVTRDKINQDTVLTRSDLM